MVTDPDEEALRIDDIEEKLSYFRPAGDAPHGTARPLFQLVEWAISNQEQSVPGFFQALAEQLRVCFSATLVTLWDYSSLLDSLTLLASSPPQSSFRTSNVMPASNSLTGSVAQDNCIVVRDLAKPRHDGRSIANPAVVTEMRLRMMFSAPVLSPGHPTVVRFVLNVCYDDVRPFPVTREHFQHTADLVGLCIEHRLDRRAIHIRREVTELAPRVPGLRSLFNAIERSVCDRTGAMHAQLFRVLHPTLELVAEGEFSGPDGEPIFSADEIAEIRQISVRDRKTLMRPDRIDDRVECHLISAPIVSAHGRVVAVLACRAPRSRDEGETATFSSVDLHALQTFAFLLAPSVQRFVRVREGGALPFIEGIFRSLGEGPEVKSRLQNAIQVITREFGCELGSIYLREGQSDRFVMRAAFGRNHNLVHKAAYLRGEGLTGSVAGGEIVNLRSRSEILRRAETVGEQWSGKFDDSIWGGDARDRLRSLLALPIRSGDTIIGVLKLANIRASRRHTDTFFTDEDLQVGQIITWLVSHLVRLENAEAARLDAERNRYRDFRLLASTSLAMQKAADESDAVAQLLAALEQVDICGTAVVLSRQDATVPLASGTISLERAEQLIARAVSNSNREVTDTHLTDVGKTISVVIPLQSDSELLGYLCVESAAPNRADDGHDLVLRAFAAQLQETLGRIRRSRSMREAAEEEATRQRFMIADAVAVVAVHRVRHTLSHAKTALEHRINAREVREHRFVFEQMRDLQQMLNALDADLTSALQIVRKEQGGRFDLAQILDAVARRWNEERRGVCAVAISNGATDTFSSLNPDSAAEIFNILFVNARQAHAKSISVTLSNPPPVELPIHERDVDSDRSMYIRRPLCVEVADNGHGFGGDMAERIFDPSFTTKNRRSGTGLGLYVARLLTRRAGGELTAMPPRPSSTGATFRVYLPAFRSPT